MKIFGLRLLCVWLLVAPVALAQDVIPLYPGVAPGGTAGSSQESSAEKQYFSKTWNTEVVTNVSRPTMMVFKPAADLKINSAVVICPGGGFMALSINSEGTDVAKYLAARGMTAFVLKYRRAHTGDDATQEFGPLFANRPKFDAMMKDEEPLAVADGLAAVAFVRHHAAEFGISPERVGMIGFSAGATVTAEVALHYKADGRPAYVAPIYGVALSQDAAVPADAPPMFITAATDDSLGLAPGSISLWQKWAGAHKPVELHMYAKGGHGFGMHAQGIPTDHWIDRFADWLQLEGFLNK